LEIILFEDNGLSLRIIGLLQEKEDYFMTCTFRSLWAYRLL